MSRRAPSWDLFYFETHQDRALLSPVRPKLNVKPSVVKPAVQLKPAQKRRGAQRSAVAAVKPLNSSAVPKQETVCSSATPHFVSPPLAWWAHNEIESEVGFFF